MTNDFKRIEIDANLPIADQRNLIQGRLDAINTENGTVVSSTESFNPDTYMYNVTIYYTTP